MSAKDQLEGVAILYRQIRDLLDVFGRRATEAEQLVRDLMRAGLAAVEQARREEREECLRIIADEYEKPRAYSLRNAAARIRARGTQ